MQVKLALQKLACVSTTPSIALNEAAELLCKHLTVGLCRYTTVLMRHARHQPHIYQYRFMVPAPPCMHPPACLFPQHRRVHMQLCMHGMHALSYLPVPAHSITGFADHCTSFVLLAAFGSGASELEKMPVMSGSECSHALLLEQPACLHYKITNDAEAAQLPPDFKALYDIGGMRSFLSIPIATDHEVVGALTIAKEDETGFEIDW